MAIAEDLPSRRMAAQILTASEQARREQVDREDGARGRERLEQAAVPRTGDDGDDARRRVLRRQVGHGGEQPLLALKFPKLFNLRTDPYEFAYTTSNTYWDWTLRHAFLAVPTQALVAKFIF